MRGPAPVDPFRWVEVEGGVRVLCACHWAGPWRQRVWEVRADESAHTCRESESWRRRRSNA